MKKDAFSREHSPKGILQFDKEDIVYEELKVTLYKIPELNTNGVLYADIMGYNHKYIIGTDGDVREVIRHKGTHRIEYGPKIKPYTKNYPKSKGDVNLYFYVDLVKPDGRTVKEDLGRLVLTHFKPKPKQIIFRASKTNSLFDYVYTIPKGKLKCMYKDAKGTNVNVDTVCWAFASDIQYDSMKSGRNVPPCMRNTKIVVAFDDETDEILKVYESETACGKESNSPRNHGGIVSNATKLRRSTITMADGRKAYIREYDKLSSDIQRIALNRMRTKSNSLF